MTNCPRDSLSLTNMQKNVFSFSLFWSHCLVVVSTSTFLLILQSHVDKVWENKKRKVETNRTLGKLFFSSFLVVNESSIHTLLCVKSLVQNKWVRQTFFFYPRSSIFTMTRTLMKIRGTEKEKIEDDFVTTYSRIKKTVKGLPSHGWMPIFNKTY